MEKINLSKTPNQSFFVDVDGKQFDFRLHYFRQLLYCDVSVDGELVAGSIRCVPNGWLVPFEHADGAGNFRFETYNDEYPDCENFGLTCFLMYYSKEEMEEM